MFIACELIVYVKWNWVEDERGYTSTAVQQGRDQPVLFKVAAVAESARGERPERA